MTTNPIKEAYLLMDPNETVAQIEIDLLKQAVADLSSAIWHIEQRNDWLTDDLEIGERGGGHTIRAWQQANPKDARVHRIEAYHLIRAATMLKTLLT